MMHDECQLIIVTFFTIAQSSDERRLLSSAVQKAKQLGVQIINPVTLMDVIRYHCDITVTMPAIYYSRLFHFLNTPYLSHLT